MKSAPAIGFEYRSSRSLAACVVLVWLFASSALAVCGLSAWSKIALALAASLYAAWVLHDFLRPSCRHLLWHEAGYWRLRDTDEKEHIVELHHAVVLGSLVVLSLRGLSIGKMSIVLLPDNCAVDIRRRLRVRLARASAR